ncbi:MAG TPA: hypothetical protein VFK86_04295 [Bauldia sp.]|nr:hypothetical protein [Bauldia sp.]
MTERKREQPPEPAREADSDEITLAEADGAGEIDHRKRRKAASSLLSPAIPPAGAGALIDADPRLDDRSETEEALERAKGTPD